MGGGEYFTPKPIAAGTKVTVGSRLGGMLASAAGNIKITDFGGTVIVASLPVATGFNRIGINFSYGDGNIIESLDTAAGALLI